MPAAVAAPTSTSPPRCTAPYRHAEDDGLIDPAENRPARWPSHADCRTRAGPFPTTSPVQIRPSTAARTRLFRGDPASIPSRIPANGGSLDSDESSGHRSE
jgi:hypothetical protein